MIRRALVLGIVSALLLGAGVVLAADKPGGEVSDLVVVTATVEKIDLATREVTLKGEDGKLETITVGPEARNLDQVKVGDKVAVKYYQALAIFVTPPGGKPEVAEAVSMQRAPLGAKPGGDVGRVVEAIVTVEAVDMAKRTVTVRGPRGNVTTIKVGDQVKNLDQVKVGDQIVARYTEALAIYVDKP